MAGMTQERIVAQALTTNGLGSVGAAMVKAAQKAAPNVGVKRS